MKLTIEQELEKKFTGKRLQAALLAKSYARLGLNNKAERVEWCGTELTFKSTVTEPAHGKLIKANFCKDRLCGMCGWRRSKKIFGQISKIMNNLEPNYHFVFMSFTVKNCSGKELKNTIDKLQAGFYTLSHSPMWRKAYKGYFRILEITRNADLPKQFEFHPHFHVICAVNKSYFTDKTYISHGKMREKFAEIMKLDYLPQIEMHKIKPRPTDKEKALIKAVKEVAKYTVKSSDFLRDDPNETDHIIKHILNALASRRVCGFGGCFKKVAQELKLEDAIDGDLINTDIEDELRPDLAYIISTYKWQAGYGYTLIKRKEEIANHETDDTLL